MVMGLNVGLGSATASLKPPPSQYVLLALSSHEYSQAAPQLPPDTFTLNMTLALPQTVILLVAKLGATHTANEKL